MTRRAAPASRTDASRHASPPGRSGPRGEQLAAAALQAIGYRIVARNLRTRRGEIDLLARRGRLWIAIEVKARADHPAPERHVDAVRCARLAGALEALAPSLRPRPRALAVEIVAVRWRPEGPELTHFRAPPPVSRPGLATGTWRRRQATWYGWPSSVSGLPVPHRPATMPAFADQIIPRRKLLLMLCEAGIFTLVLLAGTSAPPLSTRSFLLFQPSMELLHGLLSSLTLAIICQASMSYCELYDWKKAQNRAELGNRLVRACGGALVAMSLLAVTAPPSMFFFPGLADVGADTWKLIVLLAIGFVCVYLFRHGFHWFFYRWRFGERVVVLGSSTEALNLARMIADSPMAGFEVFGLVTEAEQPSLETRPDDPPVLGTLDSLRDLCRSEGISRVVVALRERRGKVPVDRLLECRMDGVQIEERESMYERLTGKLAVESMRPSYLIYGRGFARDPMTMVLKRVLDILASLVGLVASLPICLLAAAAVRCTSHGPVFFRQERVGQDGQTFRLIKFRTMRVDAERESGPVWAEKNDSRVTFVGRFLRRTRIDEIPQFLNILGGQMSFVGPRPERPHFVEQLTHEIPFYPLRHTVKPGLTGWAQVRHPYGASIDDAREKLRYDLYYIKNTGLVFDLTIILRTVNVILRGHGAR
ncbi:MAG: YraN family protein [Planctomycetes bacterium]|nr:YraN family protein [Planctomycetota bacterium]